MSGSRQTVALGLFALAIGALGGYTYAIGWWPIGISPECPDKLKEYCDKWTVSSSLITESGEHMDVTDKFSIAAKSKGVEPPIWLTAKSQLKDRWKGQDQIKLREIESGGAVQCMVGRIDLAHAEEIDHDWHQLTITTEQKPTGQTDDEGNPITETELAICLSKRDNDDWPNQCEISSCVEETDDTREEAPQAHGGRAHAQN